MDRIVLPSPRSDYVELSKSRTGKLFRKQILHFGSFQHPTSPKQKIHVDKDVAAQLVKNFHEGHCDIVQVPIVNAANQHVEDPLRNLGEVVDLDFDEKGVYATIDARKPEYAAELGKTLIGASAMMHLDYTDTKTGRKVGPTLLHVAVTNRPYITNLDGFQEIVAASADNSEEEVVFLTATDNLKNSDGENSMTKEELIALLKAEHGIDVAALQAAPPAATDETQELVSALSAVLREAGSVSLSATEDDDELDISDVAAAVIELSQEKLELSETVAELKAESDALKLSAATDEIEKLVKVGKILPAQKDVMLEIRLTNPETFSRLVPDAPVVALAAIGAETHDEPDSKKFDDEVSRLADLANSSRSGRKR